MPIYDIRFIITGDLKISAETADEAYDIVRSWTISTIIDDAIDIAVDIEDPELKNNKR